MPRSNYKPSSNKFSRPYGSRGRSGRYDKYKSSRAPRYNKNEYIRAEEVQLIDSSGNNVGVIKTSEALSMARDQELDLVEVAPNVEPPVCKIMSWSKFLYEQKKKEKQAKKNKQKELKEFRFGTFIAENDKMRNITRAKEFLSKGHNVKITVRRKGRTPVEQSKELLNELLTLLSEYSTIDSKPSYEGRQISIIFKGGSASNKPKKQDAEVKDTENSSEEIQKDKAQGGEGVKDSLQQKSSGTSKDKEVNKS